MGRVADAGQGIQFRLLNRSKGPAVQGPRAQSDRKIYRQTMRSELEALDGITIIEGEVTDFLLNDGRVTGHFLGRWHGDRGKSSCPDDRARSCEG